MRFLAPFLLNLQKLVAITNRADAARKSEL
jgi:hypothetical protein